MKLLLLHGLAIASSRKKLTDIKQSFTPDNVVTFEKGAEQQEVLANLQSLSLFAGERLVVWENPPESFQLAVFYSQLPVTLALWFDHEVDTKNWKDAQTLFFPEAKEISVFPFLDHLGNKESSAFSELDKLKRGGFDSQYIITMIFYLLRNLVATPKSAKAFVKSKNERMKANFSLEELVKLYRSVLDLDFKVKSGLLDETQAQFLLVNLFLY
ncbi:hypothetical protein HY386_01145 [Candidatus Daviesbacteria bacterium]|nr:hypothetical protein [Candidatus Daviesbacteria bacterium]